MKKIIRILLLAGMVTPLLFSCNDDESKNIFPDKYIKILSLKESGIKDIRMNTTQQSVVESIMVLKGGGRPNTVSNVRLEVLTKEEACAIGGYEPDMIEIIPSDSYEMATGQNIKLEGDESHKYVPLTLYPSKIYSEMKENHDITWVLPIALVSSTDTINEDLNKLLIRCDVRSPLVEWNMEEEQMAEIVYKTLEYPLSLKVSYSEENTLDFTCALDASDNDNLVQEYNNRWGTNYELLPAEAYSFDKFNFTAGDKEDYTNLILSRTGLQSDRTYLLPLKLSSLSTTTIEKTDEVRYLVVTNPKYCYKDVDRTSWKIAFSNNQNPWRRPDFFVSSLIDGDLVSAWASWWDGPLASGNDDFDYNSVNELGYFGFNSRRDIPNMVIVIDMGRETILGGVGFVKSNELGDQDIKSCELFLSDSFAFKPYNEGGTIENYNNVNDGNNWGSVALTCTEIPQRAGTFWYYVPESGLVSGVPRGRYLKFHPTQSHRGNNLCGFNELYMKELISIDGNALE